MNNPAPLIIANLKANKTWPQMSLWLDQIGNSSVVKSFPGTVIVAPSTPFLVSASQKIKSANLPLKLSSQDVSKFEQGAYTGEFTATQISDIASYVIIGHSERRRELKEDDEILAKKVANSRAAGLEPIYCVQDEYTSIPQGVKIVAYEPVFAIGTGNPDTPENAQRVVEIIKTRGDFTVIYGGSVSGENAKSFLSKKVIEGVLIGATNSLDPQKFIQIISVLT